MSRAIGRGPALMLTLPAAPSPSSRASSPSTSSSPPRCRASRCPSCSPTPRETCSPSRSRAPARRPRLLPPFCPASTSPRPTCPRPLPSPPVASWPARLRASSMLSADSSRASRSRPPSPAPCPAARPSSRPSLSAPRAPSLISSAESSSTYHSSRWLFLTRPTTCWTSKVSATNACASRGMFHAQTRHYICANTCG